jgi:hypothetical protein
MASTPEEIAKQLDSAQLDNPKLRELEKMARSASLNAKVALSRALDTWYYTDGADESANDALRDAYDGVLNADGVLGGVLDAWDRLNRS